MLQHIFSLIKISKTLQKVGLDTRNIGDAYIGSTSGNYFPENQRLYKIYTQLCNYCIATTNRTTFTA